MTLPLGPDPKLFTSVCVCVSCILAQRAIAPNQHEATTRQMLDIHTFLPALAQRFRIRGSCLLCSACKVAGSACPPYIFDILSDISPSPAPRLAFLFPVCGGSVNGEI